MGIVLLHLRCAVAGHALHERIGRLGSAQRGVEEVTPRVKRDISFFAFGGLDLDLFESSVRPARIMHNLALPRGLFHHYLETAQSVIDRRGRELLLSQREYPLIDLMGSYLCELFVLEVGASHGFRGACASTLCTLK